MSESTGAQNQAHLDEQRKREQIRARHQVTLVDDAKEGTVLAAQANGVYGYTYSPTAEEVPIFRTHPYQSFEVHKAANGSEHVVAFVTLKEAEQLRGDGQVTLTLYPEPWKDSTEIVDIPVDRIVKSKRQPSRDEGNYVKVDVLAVAGA